MGAAKVYPVALIVEGRNVLVVGSGAMALSKVKGLLDAGAVVTWITTGVSELEHPTLVIEGREFRPGDTTGFQLVFVATDDQASDRVVADEAHANGIWVNVADDLEASSMHLPAIYRRDPVVIAVSTGGTSPALGTYLRDLLAEYLPDNLDQLAELLGQFRGRLKAASVPTSGADWRTLLSSGVIEKVASGDLGAAGGLLEQWLGPLLGPSDQG